MSAHAGTYAPSRSRRSSSGFNAATLATNVDASLGRLLRLQLRAEARFHGAKDLGGVGRESGHDALLRLCCGERQQQRERLARTAAVVAVVREQVVRRVRVAARRGFEDV